MGAVDTAVEKYRVTRFGKDELKDVRLPRMLACHHRCLTIGAFS